MNHPEEDSIETEIRRLRSSGKSWDEIRHLFINNHMIDPLSLGLYIEKQKKEYHDKHVKSGKTKIILGILLLSSSFVITCINFHAGVSFNAIMYSFTSVGIILLGWGAYNILH